MADFDFTGFSFGEWHSNDIIVRVSDGDRYQEEIVPEVRDISVEVPGLDGEYYFGSTYGPKTIDIDIAFDSLTEAQFRELRRTFGTRQIQELIFDERPYKKYLAKISSPIELSYVCFDEPKKELVSFDGINGPTTIWRSTEETQRIYKGDGTISFTCYFPFAKSVYKTLPQTESDDWAFSSGILSVEDYANMNMDEYIYDDDNSRGVINVYNAGDIPTGFRLYFPAAVVANSVTIGYKKRSTDEGASASLVLDAITLQENDIGVLIDTNNSLVVGVSTIANDINNVVTSGNLYNSFINSGYFFKLEPNDRDDGAAIYIDSGDVQDIRIFYDYLYF